MDLPLPEVVPLPLVIGGVVLTPIIVALVEMAKALGLDVKYAPYLNGVLSLVGYGAVVLITLEPQYTSLVMYILGAFIVFLMAAGFYDRGQATLRAVRKRSSGL